MSIFGENLADRLKAAGLELPNCSRVVLSVRDGQATIAFRLTDGTLEISIGDDLPDGVSLDPDKVDVLHLPDDAGISYHKVDTPKCPTQP